MCHFNVKLVSTYYSVANWHGRADVWVLKALMQFHVDDQ